jgi:hypothetical protein
LFFQKNKRFHDVASPGMGRNLGAFLGILGPLRPFSVQNARKKHEKSVAVCTGITWGSAACPPHASMPSIGILSAAHKDFLEGRQARGCACRRRELHSLHVPWDLQGSGPHPPDPGVAKVDMVATEASRTASRHCLCTVVQYSLYHSPVYSTHPCIVLSNVWESGKGGTLRRCTDALSRMQQMAAFCRAKTARRAIQRSAHIVPRHFLSCSVLSPELSSRLRPRAPQPIRGS